jgi:hypothetical protein
MAQYDGLAVIPLKLVCRDYFQHLSEDKLTRKVALGEIHLPITRIETSQKATRGVHIGDLAAYIDARREEAQRDLAQLNRH